MITRVFALVSIGCFMAAAVAQERRDPPARDNPPRSTTTTVETRASHARRAKDILGAKINISGDYAIGTVDDIIFSDDGYVDYLVVLKEGKSVLVPWQAAKFNLEKRTAMVTITQDRFREVPVFTYQQLPQIYEPAYVQRIYGYYGVQVPAHRTRVIERRR